MEKEEWEEMRTKPWDVKEVKKKIKSGLSYDNTSARFFLFISVFFYFFIFLLLLDFFFCILVSFCNNSHPCNRNSTVSCSVSFRLLSKCFDSFILFFLQIFFGFPVSSRVRRGSLQTLEYGAFAKWIRSRCEINGEMIIDRARGSSYIRRAIRGDPGRSGNDLTR